MGSAETKVLHVVYKDKDKIGFSKLKALIDTGDENPGKDESVSAESGAVRVRSWNEKEWLTDNKARKGQDFSEKVLFLGDVKGTEELARIMEVKFDWHGVSYGFAGNQALLMVDKWAVSKRKDYEEVIKDLQELTTARIASEQKKAGVVRLAHMNYLIKDLFRSFIPIVGDLPFVIKDFFEDAALVRAQQMIFLHFGKLSTINKAATRPFF